MRAESVFFEPIHVAGSTHLPIENLGNNFGAEWFVFGGNTPLKPKGVHSMNAKYLGICIIAASLGMPTIAFSQSDSATFWSGEWIRDFYTDDSMTTMKSSAEAQAAFAKMSPENQAKLKTECQGTYDRKYSDICTAALAK